MSKNTKALNKIRKTLIDLQKTGCLVMEDLRRSDRNLYEHLSKLYLWWRDASKQKGYLEGEYETLRLKYRSNVVYGINFSPLLRLAYRNNNLDHSSRDVYSRALNKVHEEFEKKPNLYNKVDFSKLANFIEQAGGLTKLAGYKPEVVEDYKLEVEDNNEEDEFEDINDCTELNNEDFLLRSKALLLLADGIQFHGESEIKTSAYIQKKPSNFSIILAYETADGLKHIDTQYDNEMIEKMLIKVMPKRFDCAVQTIRPFFELIQTQCLPQSVESFIVKLIDKTTIKESGKRSKTYTSHRRVMYRHETNEFILSPMNALSGVVSTVKPFISLILADCVNDVYMPVSEREVLEKDLLRNFEFNLYNAEHPTLPIPQFPYYDLALHVVHLRHRSRPNDYLNISFWPFYSSLEQPQDQLSIDSEYIFTPTWHAHVDRNEIKHVFYKFIYKWLEGNNEKYMTRYSHQNIRVTFNKTNWKFEFTFKYNDYVNVLEIPIKSVSVSDQSIRVVFKMKDFLPAFKSLTELPIYDVVDEVANQKYFDLFDDDINSVFFVSEENTDYKGGIMLELNEDMLCIKFSTYTVGGSEHSIYIPTVDYDGNRSTAPFKRYYPK